MEDPCCICLDALDPRGGKPIYNPGCGHGLHFHCLLEALEHGNDGCPQCRCDLGLPDLLKPLPRCCDDEYQNENEYNWYSDDDDDVERDNDSERDLDTEPIQPVEMPSHSTQCICLHCNPRVERKQHVLPDDPIKAALNLSWSVGQYNTTQIDNDSDDDEDTFKRFPTTNNDRTFFASLRLVQHNRFATT
jgi:hypothetical protein